MANKYEKMLTTYMSLGNDKTVTRYHYTSMRKANIQNTNSTNAGENVEQQELTFIAGRNSHFGKHFGSFLQR